MVTGTVKWLDITKGFGFSATDGGNKRRIRPCLVVERSGVSDLADIQKVNFDVEAGRDKCEPAVYIDAA